MTNAGGPVGALGARLFALTDLGARPDSLAALSSLAEDAEPGSVALILRDRDAPIERRLAWGHRLREAARRSGQAFIVADRLDLALGLEADGVHLPSGGILPSDARRLLGPDAWLSRALHDVATLPDVELAELHAVFVSPVWAERKGRAALGASGLLDVATRLRVRSASLRVVALGGVEAQNAAQTLSCGASAVAAIGSVLDPAERRRLLRALAICR